MKLILARIAIKTKNVNDAISDSIMGAVRLDIVMSLVIQFFVCV